MANPDAQKSEVHQTSADAGSSPHGPDNAGTTGTGSRPGHTPDQLKRPIDPPVGGMQVVRDDTDAGGPLVIRSEDPNLNPPRPPVDPFPTDRKPEIDPPVPTGE